MVVVETSLLPGLHLCSLFFLPMISKFAIVHKVFGCSNVTKMLKVILISRSSSSPKRRCSEQFSARVTNPVYGCVGIISYLESQVSELQKQLAVAQAEILSMQM
ncbi:LOB domain-containing protein 12 [Glycine max]|nr:LOB domain-containing protein 12 [Glycine max]